MSSAAAVAKEQQAHAPSTAGLAALDAQLLRADLAELTETRLAGLLSAGARAAVDQEVYAPACAELKVILHSAGPRTSAGRCAALALLLVFGGELARDEAQTIFEQSGTDALLAAGLLRYKEPRQPNSGFRSNFSLRPARLKLGSGGGSGFFGATETHLETAANRPADQDDYWFCSDLGYAASGRTPHPEFVMGIGGATRSLLRLTPPPAPAESVLDLGTGCGVQAIVNARAGAEVTASDISPRCLDFAALNAKLNAVQLTLQRGDLLQPFEGQRFSRIVTNPPFVITPPDSGENLVYRATPRPGDQLTMELLQSLPTYLEDGGQALLLGNWLHPETETWEERLSRALAPHTDAWILERQVQSPEQYALMWLKDADPDFRHQNWAQQLTSYAHLFVQLKARAVGFGYVVLRRRRGGDPVGLLRVESDPGLGAPDANAVQAWTQRVTALEEAGFFVAGELQMNSAVRCWKAQKSPEVTEIRYYEPGQEDPQVMQLADGENRRLQVSSAFAALFGACDGELRVEQIVIALETLLQTPAPELEKELLPQLALCCLNGFILPPATGTLNPE